MDLYHHGAELAGVDVAGEAAQGDVEDGGEEGLEAGAALEDETLQQLPRLRLCVLAPRRVVRAQHLLSRPHSSKAKAGEEARIRRDTCRG